MVIEIGTRVFIKRATPNLLKGEEAVVIGYEQNPPTAITRLQLERPGDVTFKWPKCFPWDVEVVKEANAVNHAEHSNKED